MKKIISALMMLFMMTSCASCGGDTVQTAPETEKPVAEFTTASPSNGESVRLTNDTVNKWWTNFVYDPTYSEPYRINEDIYYPDPVVFTWASEPAADSYTVYISENVDMSDAETYTTDSSTLSLDHLFTGTEYYWRVEGKHGEKKSESPIYSFKTEEGIRAVRIDGVSNTRDIGGFITADGRRVKQGMIYRGGRMDLDDGTLLITDEGRDYMLNVLGIKTDYDLRGAKGPSPLGEDVNYLTFDGRYYAGGDRGLMKRSSWKIFKREIEAFAVKENYPIYIHCSLGRDRTGTLAFMINGLLGVDEQTLLKEYEISMLSVMGGSFDNAPMDAIQANINSLIDYMHTMEGDTLSECIEAYLLKIGVTQDTIDTIRNILLEDVK